jgi:membrane-associated protease RseP (regulator of RpoE activity)
MRILISLLSLAFVAGCTYSTGDDNGNQYSCSNRDQKRFVRDATEDWYLWNDLLPDKIRLGDYETPVDLLASLVAVQPLDDFSYIGSAAADAAFFGAGQYLGFGFSWRRVAADDIRLTQVFGGSPASAAGLSRGQRIIALDGRTIEEIEAAEGAEAVLSQETVEFTMREVDGITEFTATVRENVVTIDPVPRWNLIQRAGSTPVGYVSLVTFVATADAELDEAFASFNASGVTDVIVDLRYNSGGLVSTAEWLADLLGGQVAENLTFTRTLFNADRSEEYDSEEFFSRLANSINLSRLVVIATGNTASASEMITNGLEPHVDVTIVGADTFGKPVGQVGFQFCDNVLRVTAFQTVNADGFGDYFGGLPVDCPAPDDLSVPVGDAADPNVVAAMGYLETGACPASPARFGDPAVRDPSERRGPPWREYAGAW